MRIAVLTNDLDQVKPAQATVLLARTLQERGHEVWMLGIGDLSLDHGQRVVGRARMAPRERYRSSELYLGELRSSEPRPVALDAVDALLLRTNPARDKERPWAQAAAIQLGRLAARAGVVVLSDPEGLARAHTKLYLQQFPEEVRPRTLITRDRSAIRAFAASEQGPIVLKPMLGTGGADVFLVHREDHANLNQIIEVIARNDFVICQEYLPAASEGDTRLLLMNGRPLRLRGKVAAVRRRRTGEDLRSNVSVGGQPEPAEISPAMLHIAELMRPQLVADGLFLVGLDLIGDKVVEVNVYAPGGLEDAQRFEKVPFTSAIAEAIERKVRHRQDYGSRVSNLMLATL